MIIIKTVSEKYFTYNGIGYAKIYQPLKQGVDSLGIYNIYDSRQQLINSSNFREFEVDGVIYGSIEELFVVLLSVVYYSVASSLVVDVQSKTDKGGYSGTSQDLKNELDTKIFEGAKTYQTKALLLAVDPVPSEGTPAKVSNDSVFGNNGYYSVVGGVWVFDSYLVENQIFQSNESNPVSGKAVFDEVKERIEEIPVKSINTSEDGFHFLDELGRSCFGVRNDGSIYISKLDTDTELMIKGLLGSSFDKVRGKRISILGDSISTLTGGGNAGLIYPQQYWGILESEQNCNTYVNAIGGTTIKVGGQGTAMSSDTRINTLNSEFEPELIFVFGGVNDFLQDIVIGNLGDTGNSTSFYGALDYMYRKIQTDYNARVFHILPMHNKFSQSGFTVPEYNGFNYLTDYIKAIREVAARYGVGIINTFDDSGITSFNIDELADDGIHVKSEGHRMIYNTIISETNNKL
jgi:lysophospholipase L1-like esterase